MEKNEGKKKLVDGLSKNMKFRLGVLYFQSPGSGSRQRKKKKTKKDLPQISKFL